MLGVFYVQYIQNQEDFQPPFDSSDRIRYEIEMYSELDLEKFYYLLIYQ